jgi:hypothetical protein
MTRRGDAFVTTWVSPAVTRLGYTPEDATTVTWWVRGLHPDDRDRVLASEADLRKPFDRVTLEAAVRRALPARTA